MNNIDIDCEYETYVIERVTEYLELPRGYPIENPERFILVGKFSDDICRLIGSTDVEIIIKNKAIKHIIEQRQVRSEVLLLSLPAIISFPDKISISHIEGRFKFAKIFDKNHIAVIEITKTPDSKNQVVSVFVTDGKTYNKLQDISGGPEFPSLA